MDTNRMIICLLQYETFFIENIKFYHAGPRKCSISWQNMLPAFYRTSELLLFFRLIENCLPVVFNEQQRITFSFQF